MKKILLFTAVILFIYVPSTVYTQGCVAIRGGASCGGNMGNSLNLSKGEFNVLTSFRHFKSFRHFRGTTEEIHRIEEGTEVINRSSFLDFNLIYGINNRLFTSINLPFAFHHRSSMYEHGGNPPNGLGERHETSSRGLSDIRLGIGYWLFDPQKHNFNYSVGLGLKLHTGKYDYTDTFYNQGINKDENITSVVDQSIQLGDGGTGLILDLQGYHPLSQHFGLTSNIYYLFNYQGSNGVLTRNGRSEFSCPDQFALRLGTFYSSMKGFNAYLGGRVEGVPSTDIFGSSEGYRRPGYAISIEPGVGYFKNKYSIFLSVPFAVERNRIQSYEDKQRTLDTGVYTQGDAAFADYLLNFNFSYRFGGQPHRQADMVLPHEDIFKK